MARPLAYTQPYFDNDKPGRLDRRGVMWWQCDPSPTWFYWETDLFGIQTLVKRDDNKNVFSIWPGLDGWADEHIKLQPPPCSSGFNCRLYSWSDCCNCCGWGFNDKGCWDGPDYELHVQVAYQKLYSERKNK